MLSTDNFGKFSTNVSRFLINYGVRFLFAGLLLYCCWVPLQNITMWFSWHVILCTFGYIPLMAESIMLFVGDELWSKQVSRKVKSTIHAVLISLSVAFVIVGNSLVFYYFPAGTHLHTTHGIAGLVSMVVLIISIGVGGAVNHSEDLKKILPIQPIWFKISHNIIGIIGFLIGIVSLCFGYYTNYFVFYTSEESRKAAVIATVVVSLWALNGALLSAYNQIKTILT